MFSFLMFPLVLVLGVPFGIGLWTVSAKFYRSLKGQVGEQSAFVGCLVLAATLLCLMTAPAWIIGLKGYIIVSAVYIGCVAVGAPHMYRILKFAGLQLDSDPTNDPVLPGDKPKSGNK